MAPYLVTTDTTYQRNGHAVRCRNDTVLFSPIEDASANLYDVFGSQLCASLSFPSCVASLIVTINNVIKICSVKQMLWITTRRVIAPMQYARRRISEGEHVREPVCPWGHTAPPNLTVSVRSTRACPLPTTSCHTRKNRTVFVHPLPKIEGRISGRVSRREGYPRKMRPDMVPNDHTNEYRRHIIGARYLLARCTRSRQGSYLQHVRVSQLSPAVVHSFSHDTPVNAGARGAGRDTTLDS